MNHKPIYLSPPDMTDKERSLLLEAFDSNWIAPKGAQLDRFEKELEKNYIGKRVLALNSGTSALHLSLVLAEVTAGDEVIVGTFTFSAAGNVVIYCGAKPIFLDSESETWNLDPRELENYLSTCKKKPKAVIVTHLYGIPAKIDSIKTLCHTYGVTLIEDAAEAIGSTFKSKPVGSFGKYGILSFNGNKLITTGGGGALILSENEYDKALYLATQANDDPIGYNHTEVGYNYRLSNVLAAIGLAQLSRLDELVDKKRKVFEYYKEHLPNELKVEHESSDAIANRWLTTPIIDGEFKPSDLVRFLAKKNIQARLLWKPLHLHEAYKDSPFIGSGVAENIFNKGLCLPSGTGLLTEGIDFIIDQINLYLSSK